MYSNRHRSSHPCVGGNVMLPRLVNDISLIEDECALTRHGGVGVKGVAFLDMVDEVTDDSHWRESWKFQWSGWTRLAEIRSPRVHCGSRKITNVEMVDEDDRHMGDIPSSRLDQNRL